MEAGQVKMDGQTDRMQGVRTWGWEGEHVSGTLGGGRQDAQNVFLVNVTAEKSPCRCSGIFLMS